MSQNQISLTLNFIAADSDHFQGFLIKFDFWGQFIII